jgi:hypothetical protein
MTGYREDRGTGLRFAATPDAVHGYGGRGIDGTAYRPPGGYLFRDQSGNNWWIIFQESPDSSSHGPRAQGDILACSESHDELVHVRVLASNVNRIDADVAFGQNTPSTYEDAAKVAARIA